MLPPNPDDHAERMVPELHRPSLMYAEHMTRYLAAQPLVAGKRVLDIASGSGYGSHLLAQTAASVTGVDVSATAVDYARATYPADNLEFRVGDATDIPLPDASVDVVVTFETIEHVADYRRFLGEIDRVLAPDGLAIISTPNDIEFVEGNHFHLHEFVYDELVELVRERFDHVEPYFQGTWTAAAVGPAAVLGEGGPLTADVINLAPLAQDQFLYFYLLCARRPVTEAVRPLVGLGAHHSDRRIQLEGIARDERTRAEREDAVAAARADLEAIMATRSYRLARRLSALAARLHLTRGGAG